MGSLNIDGTIKLQPRINRAIRHQGDFLSETNTETDTKVETIASSGVIRTDFDSRGVAWQPGGTNKTAGLSMDERDADNSVERKKFTANGEEAGNLQQHVTRKIDGIFASVSDRQAIVDPVAAIASGLIGGDTTGPMQTITERKVFWLDSDRGKDINDTLAAWQIFDSQGNAVGADTGVTDIDKTANEGLIGKPE